MATLLKVDDSETEIDPFNPPSGVEHGELFALVGRSVRLVPLTADSMMVIKSDNGIIPALRNYRATKVLQFFTDDQLDEVRGSALIVNRAELILEGVIPAELAQSDIRVG